MWFVLCIIQYTIIVQYYGVVTIVTQKQRVVIVHANSVQELQCYATGEM